LGNIDFYFEIANVCYNHKHQVANYLVPVAMVVITLSLKFVINIWKICSQMKIYIEATNAPWRIWREQDNCEEVKRREMRGCGYLKGAWEVKMWQIALIYRRGTIGHNFDLFASKIRRIFVGEENILMRHSFDSAIDRGLSWI
jgi:hypothetical protein